jgi:hypothetical protein
MERKKRFPMLLLSSSVVLLLACICFVLFVEKHRDFDTFELAHICHTSDEKRAEL